MEFIRDKTLSEELPSEIPAGNITGTVTTDFISDFDAASDALINDAAAKSIPIDTDFIPLMDSADGNTRKKLSWLNIRTTLKSLFDTLYAPIANFFVTDRVVTIYTNDGEEGGNSVSIILDPIAQTITASTFTVISSFFAGSLYAQNFLVFRFNNGAGGQVVQEVSKSNGVLLNKPTGQITMHAANLAPGAAVAFVLTSFAIAANDVVIVSIKSGATSGAYAEPFAEAVSAGSCRIQLRNQSNGNLAEAVVLNFVVLRGRSS